jgi:DNA-binding MarR family transcriptional regulator
MTTATASPRARGNRTKDDARQPAFDTWLLLQQGYLLTYKAVDQALTRAGISYAQAAVLIALGRAGAPLPLSRLARTLVQEAQSVTSLIDRLEARGLVRRMPDKRDRRVVNVVLTPSGDELLVTVLPVAAGAARSALADFDSERLALLRECVEQIRARSAALLGIDIEGPGAPVRASEADTADR